MTWVYVLGALVLFVAEMIAVLNRKPGDTITERVKSNVFTWMAMSALIVWASFHFIVDVIFDLDMGADLIVVALGAFAGYLAYRSND